MPASMPLCVARGRSNANIPLLRCTRLGGDCNANSIQDHTRQGHFNCRRVARACRRLVVDFFVYGPRNQLAYGTCGRTQRHSRELDARSSAFRGMPAASRRRCAGLRRNDSDAHHDREGKVRCTIDFTTGPARYRTSGATKVIRSVMHPACSKKPPLARQSNDVF